jgi:uncharacterized surface protein with fasciclin (FAS1) repeats
LSCAGGQALLGIGKFVELLQSSGVWKEMAQLDCVTIFAPTDAAMAAAAAAANVSTPQRLEAAALLATLRYHVVADDWYHLNVPANAGRLRLAQSVLGAPLFVYTRQGPRPAAELSSFVNEAAVIDVPGLRAPVWPIDRLLLAPVPPALADAPLFALGLNACSIFKSLIATAGLEPSAVAMRTLLVPPDEAFANLDVSLDALVSQSDLARQLVLNHVLSDMLPTSGLAAAAQGTGQGVLVTMGSGLLRVRVDGVSGDIYFRDGREQSARVLVSNVRGTDGGVMHMIDRVLFVPSRPISATAVDRLNTPIVSRTIGNAACSDVSTSLTALLCASALWLLAVEQPLRTSDTS